MITTITDNRPDGKPVHTLVISEEGLLKYILAFVTPEPTQTIVTGTDGKTICSFSPEIDYGSVLEFTVNHFKKQERKEQHVRQ